MKYHQWHPALSTCHAGAIPRECIILHLVAEDFRVGLSLEFYAGDAYAIGADFAEVEFDGLRDGRRARAYADFSLHLAPGDLDSLSAALGAPPLRDSLASEVGAFDCGGGGANLVSPGWVRAVAAADDGAAPQLAAAWFRRLGDGAAPAVTPDAARAVGELIRLCQLAVREDVQVVHAWYF